MQLCFSWTLNISQICLRNPHMFKAGKCDYNYVIYTTLLHYFFLYTYTSFLQRITMYSSRLVTVPFLPHLKQHTYNTNNNENLDHIYIYSKSVYVHPRNVLLFIYIYYVTSILHAMYAVLLYLYLMWYLSWKVSCVCLLPNNKHPVRYMHYNVKVFNMAYYVITCIALSESNIAYCIRNLPRYGSIRVQVPFLEETYTICTGTTQWKLN